MRCSVLQTPARCHPDGAAFGGPPGSILYSGDEGRRLKVKELDVESMTTRCTSFF